VIGASGSGTTTLARALAATLDATPLDSDNDFWLPTQPPFRERRDPALRLRSMLDDLARHPRAIVSGAFIGWGDELEHAFDLVVFLSLPHELRVARLRAREIERYAHANEEFIAWAAGYDDDPPTSRTRNRRRQHEWLATRRCPVLRLEGDLTVAARVERVLEFAWSSFDAGNGGSFLLAGKASEPRPPADSPHASP
jgi:adenylate kinase family enzyme